MKTPTSILVVDDNASMVKTVTAILAFKGYAVRTALSASEALELLANHSFDILLTDVKMPGMNGVELHRRAHETHPAMRTFLMTAYADDAILQVGLDQGISDVLTKPLDIERLLALLADALTS